MTQDKRYLFGANKSEMEHSITADSARPHTVAKMLGDSEHDGLFFDPCFSQDLDDGQLGLLHQLKGTAADATLLKAASTNKEQRRRFLLEDENRASMGTREGSYAAAIIPDHKDVLSSKLFLIDRQAAVTSGLGTPGGLLEPEDTGISPEREWREELAGELANCEEDKEILDGILAVSDFVPLFTCRDDTHIIDRGWGFPVDAHAHALAIPTDEQDRAAALFERLTHSHRTGEETKGALLLTLRDLPARCKDFAYAHEAFASLISAQMALEDAHLALPKPYADTLSFACMQEDGLLQHLADGMHVDTQTLQAMYLKVMENLRTNTVSEKGVELQQSDYAAHFNAQTTTKPSATVHATGNMREAPRSPASQNER